MVLEDIPGREENRRVLYQDGHGHGARAYIDHVNIRMA